MLSTDALQDRVVLITGGGSGLGRSMASRFLDLGARVGIIGRNETRLRDALEFFDAGDRAASAAADVRDPDQVEAAIASIEADLGPLDTVVNNAAGNFLAPTEDLSARAFDAVVGIVLYGTFNVSRAAGRRFIDRGEGGDILNIVATYAWMGSAFVVPSAAAKAGVLAMTRSLAVEWGTYGIRVNAIAPGPFPTEGAWKALLPTPEAEDAARKQIPAGRFGEHEELGNLAAFLISAAARYITGECVTIDGGQWLTSGGSFNHLSFLPRDQVKTTMRKMRD